MESPLGLRSPMLEEHPPPGGVGGLYPNRPEIGLSPAGADAGGASTSSVDAVGTRCAAAEAAEGGSVTDRMTLSMICIVEPKKMYL